MNLFSSLMTIFFIIFLGIACCKKKIFNKAQIEGLELFLFKIIMPAYLFATTYKHDLSSLINLQYISSYLVTFSILAIIVTSVFIQKVSMSVVCVRILAAGYVNAGIYALPVITILLKDPTAAIIGNIIQVIIIQPIFIICLSAVKHKGNSLGKKIVSMMTTPIIIMPIIGISLNYLHINLPSSVVDAISQIGSGASGIALFVFGLTLGAMKITKECLNFDLLSVVFFKNILHPLIAVGVAYFMKVEGYWFYSLVIAASAPPAFVVYLISKQFSVEEEMIKKTIALSSVISTVSLILIAVMVGRI